MSYDEPAVNPIPPVVIVLCLIVVLVEFALSAAAAGMIGGPQGIGWRVAAMQDYGYSPLVMDRVLSVGDYSFDLLKRFVTYGFVHVSFTHALFAAALLLALGKFVGDVFRTSAVLIVTIGSLIIGALLLIALMLQCNAPLIGGFIPGVYGLDWCVHLSALVEAGRDWTAPSQVRAFSLIGFLIGNPADLWRVF